MWTCSKCGEQVEATFDVCWSCGTSKDGVQDPEFVKEADTSNLRVPEPVEVVKPESRTAELVVTGPCRACGSTKIIPNVLVADQGEQWDGSLKVVLYGDPQAMFFKDRLYGQLKAWICGDCGHTELRVMNPEDLYVKYLEARERGNV